MLPPGYVIYRYTEVDSTNSEALRLVAAGHAKHGAVIISERQRKGRGRVGREWISYPGNLYMSIVVEKTTDLNIISQLSFVTATAIGDVLQGVEYKWPNDVLLNGEKVCGILLESHNNEFIIVGIGINISDAPSYATYTNKYYELDIHKVIDNIINNFENEYQEWNANGFGEIKDKWMSKASNLNEQIKVQLGNEIIYGIFYGIDDDGNLILKSGNKTHYINTGEVFI